MAELLTFENLTALATLTMLEIVLGIDNIVFIAILSGKLPPKDRGRARRLGLIGAMVTRILLLLTITWIMGLTKTLFSAGGFDFSGKDLILLFGGLFLIGKATHEVHNRLEGGESGGHAVSGAGSMGAVVVQIMIMDIIFSLDSVITAVGMVNQPDAHAAPGAGAATQAAAAVHGVHWQPLAIMITAVVISIAVMMIFARPISDFVERHPTIKMLALSFLVLIGVMLVAESLDHHIPKGYIYFAMAFSLLVEILNIRMRRKATHVSIGQPHLPE